LIRLTVPSIDEDDLRAVRDVLASGFLVQGPRVAEFERTVADYIGSKHAIAVMNCTAALHLSLLALDVGPGDRVVVPTYSWPTTANVVSLCNAKPVFVDIDPRTFNMNPDSLEQALKTASVKAVIPVHAFGGMADIARIKELSDNYGATVIEDAACALGASVNNRQAGTWGALGCFSFHPRKAITTGEGGMITTDDAALARKIRALRNHGQDPEAAAPDFVMPGYNLRLTEFQGALGCTQMKKLDHLISSRRAQAERYDELFADTGIETPLAIPNSRHVFQSYVVLLPAEAAGWRKEIIAHLKSQGIETTIGTYHLPLTTFFSSQGGYERGDFPVVDDVAARALSLPLFDGLTQSDQEQVVNALRQTLNMREVSMAN